MAFPIRYDNRIRYSTEALGARPPVVTWVGVTEGEPPTDEKRESVHIDASRRGILSWKSIGRHVARAHPLTAHSSLFGNYG